MSIILDPTSPSTVFQLKITLKGIRPPIWRRVLVPGYIALDLLHATIQTVMGWDDTHLHQFKIDNRTFASLDSEFDQPFHDESQYVLSDLVKKPKDRLQYTYDFGDDWEHDIVVEKLVARDENIIYPMCTAGRRACPPEDVGGIPGYSNFLEALLDPEHSDHASVTEWAGDGFNPEALDIREVNEWLMDIPLDESVSQETEGTQMSAPLQPGYTGMESVMRKLTELMEGQSFDSIDDMSAFLDKTLTGKSVDDLVPDTPADRALALIDEAHASSDPEKRISLAQEALAVDPTCADAYVLLAFQEPDLQQAEDLLIQGVHVAEQALGPEVFEESVGSFWSIVKTRSYMRTRKSLADFLWLEDRHDEAIAHVEDLLRLNEHDNLGLRYDLVNWYLELGQTERAGELIERFEEDATCLWLFPKALWLFQAEGASDRADAALIEAFESNPHLMDACIDIDSDTEIPPTHYAIGSVEEARLCVTESFQAWSKTQRALIWQHTKIKEILIATRPRRVTKIGRNDLCHCGSGKKYKRCCLGRD